MDSPEKHGYPPLPASATTNFQFPQQYQFPTNAKEPKTPRQYSSRQMNYNQKFPSGPYTMSSSRPVSPSRPKPMPSNFARQIPQSSQHKETLTHALNHPPFFVPKSITSAIKQKQQLREFRPNGYSGDYYEK